LKGIEEMATNRVQDGDVITVTAPYAVASGGGVLITKLFGVAQYAAASGTPVDISTARNVWDLTCLSTDTPAVGAILYWDNTNYRLTTTSTSNTRVGVAVAAKSSGATTARIRLDGFAT
jgi:predicted RecA/RadA family phage recombinase